MIQAETLELLEWSRLCQHLATFAATKLGTLVAQSLPIPTTQAESERLLAQTQEVYELENSAQGGLSFEGIQDIGDALERAALHGILAGEELLAIATTLNGARQLRRVIDSRDNLPVLQELVAELRTYPELEQEIHRCIDERGRVMDRASQKLADIREQMKGQRDRIYQILNSILQRHSNAVQESLITQRGDRFVLPVKASHKDLIPGIVHDTSTSGVTLYVEPSAVVNLGNNLRQLLRREQAEEEAVRRALTEQVAAVKEDLEELLAIATTLDLAAARARYSYWLKGNPPRFVALQEPSSQEPGAKESRSQEPGAREPGTEKSETREPEPPNPEPRTPNPQPPNTTSPARPPAHPSSSITLRQLRHPLLIWQQQHEQGFPVVPVDLVIQPYIRVVAITGPNTGGKTVTLKTLGLAALMAKVGLFVPAREPVEIPWFDQILADIGDEQSLQQSLSTFSGHIRRIGRILSALGGKDEGGRRKDERELSGLSEGFVAQPPAATDDLSPSLIPSYGNGKAEHPSSLILLDEVGAGTDPSEGSALAIALLQHLANHATLTVATTHFGELKALKYQDDRFENASVEFDDVSLSPTYRLLWGIPGRSNALIIAQRLGLDAEIVAAAQELVGVGANQDVNQVIAGLEEQRRQQETKTKEAAQLVQQAERFYKEVSQRAASLQEREQALQQQQEQAVQQAIAQAKGEIAKVIRQLQQGPVTAQDAQQATESVNQLAARHLPSRKQPPKPPPGFMPKVGDRVRIPRLGQTAEVLSNPNDDNELTVRFGLMKMTVSLVDVESLQGEKVTVPEKARSQGGRSQEPGARSQEPGARSQEPGARSQKTRGRENELAETPKVAAAPNVRTSRNTLDIRGSRVADAEVALERAIATAQSGPLWIIHGHGTGKLRQGVHDFLKRHPQISRFEPAAQADGGSGATVAYVE